VLGPAQLQILKVLIGLVVAGMSWAIAEFALRRRDPTHEPAAQALLRQRIYRVTVAAAALFGVYAIVLARWPSSWRTLALARQAIYLEDGGARLTGGYGPCGKVWSPNRAIAVELPLRRGDRLAIQATDWTLRRHAGNDWGPVVQRTGDFRADRSGWYRLDAAPGVCVQLTR
jgi:hypothetical protein